MKRISRLALSLFITANAAFAPRLLAQDESELSLRSAIELALAQNLSLRIQKMDPQIAADQVIAQEAVFDPTIFSRANLSQSELEWQDSDGDQRQTISDSRSYSVGVTKRISTGAQVTASANHSRSDGSSFNPELNQLVGGGLSERASLSLEFNQPLLRDRGTDVTLAPKRRAESLARVADLETRNQVLDLLQQTELAYWRLADAYQRRDLSLSNLELSEKLVEESKEREELGLATRIDRLQAEANLAQRREQIIRADQAITEAADLLLATIGSLDEGVSIEQQVSVQPLPSARETAPEFNTYLQTALERNFDSSIQAEVLEQLEQQRILAVNDQRAQVDLTVSGSYNGLSPKSGYDAFDEAFNRAGDDWGLSLAFSLPWGSRSAKSNLRQTLRRIDQAELRLTEIKQDLLRSARSAWRDLSASSEQVKAAELVVELQEAAYEQEQGKYDEGLSTFRTLLEVQRDLDQAKLSLQNARLAAIEAEIALARVGGTLLERHQIDWNTATAPTE